MKVAAVVILYYPETDLVSNIKTYYDHVDKIFVFDNSETESSIKSHLLALPKIEFFQDFKNEGIAKRLNEGAAKCIEQGFDWMLTMDQDSFFSADAISNYLKCCNKYKNKENVAVFGTMYSRVKKISSQECSISYTHELITSGMLINLKLFKKVGGFDEALFIDGVDHDYVISAKTKGFPVIIFSNIYILHQLGTYVYRSSIKTLFLIKKKKVIHHPLRCYYIYRNMLYLESKHKEGAQLMKSIKKTTIHHIYKCFFYGRNTFKLIKYLMAARRDVKNKRMGKIKYEL